MKSKTATNILFGLVCVGLIIGFIEGVNKLEDMDNASREARWKARDDRVEQNAEHLCREHRGLNVVTKVMEWQESDFKAYCNDGYTFDHVQTVMPKP